MLAERRLRLESLDVNGNLALRGVAGVLDRVGEEVEEDLVQAGRVGLDPLSSEALDGRVCVDLELDRLL